MFRLCRTLLAKDPFKVLGLTRAATKPEVKAKFRELAKQFHPDAATGNSQRMEEINRAYNLLLKEGAYERLHLNSKGSSSPSTGFSEQSASPYRKGTSPFAKTGENILDPEDYSKVSALDSETERLTPEGRYMYQNRDTGEWVTLDRPLVKVNQPRYKSYAHQPEATAGLAEDLRRRRVEQERLQNTKSAFDRTVDRLRDNANLPSTNKWFLLVAATMSFFTVWTALKKGTARKEYHLKRSDFYDSLEMERIKQDEKYLANKMEMEILITAAALVFLAAARKKDLSDEVCPEREDTHYLQIKPPRFEVISSN